MDASRVIICSPTDVMLTELSPDEVWSCDETMEINGQHYLEIVTTRVLTKEQRVVVFDEGNHAHEYVVATEDREHSGGSIPFGTYKCPWSLQHDARLWVVNVSVGPENPVQASMALDAVLSGTKRWVKGTVTLATTGSAEMRGVSGWDALSTLIEVWGGEIDAEVTVGQTGVTSRRVMLYAQMGQQTARRRFDYLRDLSSIKRHVLQDDVACRIIPRGKSEKDDNDVEQYVTIETVNDGVEWLQNDESAAIYRLVGANGGYEYPVVYVDNGDIETPQELKEWGLSVLEDYTVPKVSYEMEVTYLYHEDYNPYGVGLGDVVQCVDLAFGDTPLRLEARVTAMTVDRVDRSNSTITVSNVPNGRSLAASVAGLGDWVNEIAVVSGGTADYLAHILDNLNAEINATGGYVYITDGQGLVTYDKAVTNPLQGTEADQATEMRGGTLRFANTKNAQGEWNWTTVITADGYLGLAATIANLTTGIIRSASGGNYWNLDTGEIRLTTATGIGDDRTIQDIIDGVNATITNVDVEYAQGTSATTAPTNPNDWSTDPPTWEVGKYIWSRTATTTGTGAAARTTYSTPVMISGRDGSNGSNGRDGVGIVTIREQYYLSTSNSTQTGGSWSYDQPTWTEGTHIWTRSEITWDTTPRTTTYTDPILARALTQANSAVAALDEDLNQEGIFNRLTNNQQWQGIYTDPTTGKYYFNAEYIHAGTMSAERIKGGSLKLGGSNNVNGVLQVLNASGTEVCRLDNNGAIMTGEISMRGTYDLFDGSAGTSGASYITSTVRVGALKFADGEVFANLYGSYIVHDRYALGGLEVGATNTNSGYEYDKLRVLPSVGSGHVLYSESDSIRLRVGAENAKYAAGLFVGKTDISMSGRAFTYIKVHSSGINNTDQYIELYSSDIRLKGKVTTDNTITTKSVTTDKISVVGTGNSAVLSVADDADITGRLTVGSNLTVSGNLNVSGYKNRLVGTENYSDRLLYCYETSAPLFGDVGSAVIDGDGTCVISIDDIFSECARTDIAYQVFLQKCGRGDLWVSEKHPTYFVVEGTPDLSFDWHITAHQTGYESDRLEESNRCDDFDAVRKAGVDVVGMYGDDVDQLEKANTDETFDNIYEYELNYSDELESLYR